MRARMFSGIVVSLAFACTESTGVNLSDVPGYLISTVRVTPAIDTIFVTDSIRTADRITFSAIATGKNGDIIPAMTFSWETSDPLIATVDSAGVVTPRKPGVVEIIASADKIGRATLVILPATMSVSVSPLVDTIFVALPISAARDTVRLRATASDLNGAPLGGVSLSWASSSPSVATVDQAGLVRAMGFGSAAITASTNGHVGAAVVHVVLSASGSD